MSLKHKLIFNEMFSFLENRRGNKNVTIYIGETEAKLHYQQGKMGRKPKEEIELWKHYNPIPRIRCWSFIGNRQWNISINPVIDAVKFIFRLFVENKDIISIEMHLNKSNLEGYWNVINFMIEEQLLKVVIVGDHECLELTTRGKDLKSKIERGVDFRYHSVNSLKERKQKQRKRKIEKE
jgi:hypothetical protein